MPFTRIADILAQTLAALGEAHQLGITHRDVKPENIFLEAKRGGGDRVKVIDFGIAKRGRRAKLTTTGEIIGTPAYMAPEQVEGGGRSGPRADLYAVGVILFALLTGQLPFDGETPTADHLEDAERAAPGSARSRAGSRHPGGLAAACVRAIDINPSRSVSDDRRRFRKRSSLASTSSRGRAHSSTSRLAAYLDRTSSPATRLCLYERDRARQNAPSSAPRPRSASARRRRARPASESRLALNMTTRAHRGFRIEKSCTVITPSRRR